MKKFRLVTLFGLIAILSVCVFSGCSKNGDEVCSVSLKDYDPSTAIEIALGDFDFKEYTVVAAYESGNTENHASAKSFICPSRPSLVISPAINTPSTSLRLAYSNTLRMFSAVSASLICGSVQSASFRSGVSPMRRQAATAARDPTKALRERFTATPCFIS